MLQERPLEKTLETTLPTSPQITTIDSEQLVNPALITKLTSCFIQVYGEAPWNEGFYCHAEGRAQKYPLSIDQSICECGSPLVSYYSQAELNSQFTHDLRVDELTKPVVAYWEANNQILAYTSVIVTSGRSRVDQFLLEAPYFGGTLDNPETALEEFWQNVPIKPDEKYVCVLDTVSRKQVRGDPHWYKTASEAARVSHELGANKFIGVTTKDTGIYGLLIKLGFLKVISDAGPVLLVYSENVEGIAELFDQVSQAPNEFAAAKIMAKLSKQHAANTF